MRLAAATLALTLAAPAAHAAAPLATEQEKVVYALGLLAAKSFTDIGLTPHEVQLVARALSDSLTQGAKPAVDLADYEPKVQEFVRERVASANKAYLDKAAREKGAQKTASGLVYSILKEGSGPSPKESDTVKVNYEGRLANGQVFDSSYRRGQPAEFALDQVVPCWREGVQKIKVGGKGRLVCPASLAYGERGAGPIPGGATLVFDVELLEVKAKP